MGYNVDYGALNALQGQFSARVGTWEQGIRSVMHRKAVVASSKNIAGNSADRLKDYLNTVYALLSVSLFGILDLFQQNYLLYIQAYKQQIDSAEDTHIDESELNERRESLLEKRTRFQQIGLAAEAAVHGIRDLVSVPSLDISEPDMKIGSIATQIVNLDDGINGLESQHVSADFAQMDAMIADLRAHLKELATLYEEYKANFSAASYFTLGSVPTLLAAIHEGYERLDSQREDVAVAVDALEKRLEQERAEYEKRKTQAEWAKAAVGVVTAIAVTACVASGVGTLLVPVVCSVGKYAFKAAANEYVEHGWNTDEWDSAYIGKEAVKGWFAGFTGAILPPGTGDVVKASVSATNSAIWSGLDTAYDQMVTTGTISDTKSIFFEAEKSGVSSFAGDLAGNAISDQLKNMPIGLGLDNYANPSNDIRHYAGKFIVGGTDKVASGIGERLVSTTVEIAYDVERNVVEGENALEGINLANRYKDVLSAKELSTDFVTGGSKEVVSSYIKERTPDPNSGLTPIIQAKLGYETDSETGLTGIVQESLSHIVDEDEFHSILGEMEEQNPSGMVQGSAGSGISIEAGDKIDWANTANSADEIEWIKETDLEGGNHTTIQSTTDFAEPVHRKMNLPQSGGSWSGEPGNSEYFPDSPEVQQAMAEYGRDSVTYTDQKVDFSPFSTVETPWGEIDTKVEIGHMVGGKTARNSKTPDGMPGNYEQAEAELEKKILDRYGKDGATQEEVKAWIVKNRAGRTWHEDPDRKTMMSVPTVINAKIKHTGGVSEAGYAQAMGDVSNDYSE